MYGVSASEGRGGESWLLAGDGHAWIHAESRRSDPIAPSEASIPYIWWMASLWFSIYEATRWFWTKEFKKFGVRGVSRSVCGTQGRMSEDGFPERCNFYTFSGGILECARMLRKKKREVVKVWGVLWWSCVSDSFPRNYEKNLSIIFPCPEELVDASKLTLEAVKKRYVWDFFSKGINMILVGNPFALNTNRKFLAYCTSKELLN